MASGRTQSWGRRDFVRGLTLAGLVGLRPGSAHADPPPETKRFRISLNPSGDVCTAPQYVAHELLYGEGFTDVQYVRYPSNTHVYPSAGLIAGEIDLTFSFIARSLLRIDSEAPLVILAGGHRGCLELIATTELRSTVDLKGKTVAISRSGSEGHIFISMFAAYVGLDPEKDINWAIHPDADQYARLLTEGKMDAFLAGPEYRWELREKEIGHAVVNTTTDPPWSHHYCCIVASNKEFVRRYPVATKRALRAILKSIDICAAEPKRVARLIADKGIASYDYTLHTMQELPYGTWRDYDPEDTVRFYALRMREIGMIKNSPQKIIAEGTDWRFLNEVKRELKG